MNGAKNNIVLRSVVMVFILRSRRERLVGVEKVTGTSSLSQAGWEYPSLGSGVWKGSRASWRQLYTGGAAARN